MSQQYPECQEEADFYGERPTDSELEERFCSNCRYDEVSNTRKGCVGCVGHTKWKSKNEHKNLLVGASK